MSSNSNQQSLTGYLILGVILALVLFFVLRKFKVPQIGSLCLVTGAVKSGKTTFALSLVLKNYRRSVRKWRLRCFALRLFKWGQGVSLPDKPLLYSNCPLAVPYVPITDKLILRQSRPVYGSTFFIQEASLLSDNLIFKNEDLSERVMLFNKLFGHETCGGLLVYDTQSIGDLPAVTRRCLGQTMYVHHLVKWVPFVLIAYVKEQRYSEDGSVVQVDTVDVQSPDSGYKRVLLSKRVWKKFDCYCYSSLTDNLPVEQDVVKVPKNGSLKCNSITSFRRFKSFDNSKNNIEVNIYAKKDNK